MVVLPLSGLCTLGAAVAVGASVGHRSSSLLTPPALALAVFAYIYALAFASGSVQRLSPIFPDTFYTNYYIPNVRLVGAQILASVTIVLIATVALTRRRGRYGVACLVAACLAGALASGSGVAAVAARTPPKDPPCVIMNATRLCYWPKSSRQAAVGVAALSQARWALSRYLRTPANYAEPGLFARLPHFREYQLPPAGQSGFQFMAVLALTPPDHCHTARATRAHARIEKFVSAVLIPEAAGHADRKLISGSLPQAQAWLQKKIGVMSSCP